MSDKTTENEIFIPATPDKRRRIGKMVSQAMPGFILAISVAGTDPATVGALLLNAFCIISGLLVVFFSVREFMLPGKGTRPGTDMVTVFTGLLVITQGSLIFNALKGFQPAHLYFLAGAIFIFKGVMIPESKIKRGYVISEDAIVCNSSLFRSKVKLVRKNLDAIYVTANTMNFRYKDGEVKMVNMSGTTNLDEMVVVLKRILLPGG